MATPRTRFLRASLMLALATVLAPAAARAAGFEYGPQGVQATGRGGAITAGVSDPSAIWWNPARLATMRGTQLMYNHTLSKMDLTFDRAPAQRCKEGPGKGTCTPDGYPTAFPRETQQEGFFPMGLSLGLTTDFGLKDWGFGLGVNGPAAYGKVGYADSAPGLNQSLPLASANRYSVTDLSALIANVSLAAAYKYKEWFGIGVTVQYVAVPWVRYGMNILAPKPDTPANDPARSQNDLRVDVDMADWLGFSGILGLWVQPVKGFEIAAAARVAPIQVRAKGDLKISGQPSSFYSRWGGVTVPGRLSFDYPVDVRVALRYVDRKGDREAWDVEADYAWEQWSDMDAFRIKFDVAQVEALGTNMLLNSLTMPRNLKDTHSVRLGGSYNPLPDHLWVRAGAWWESGAQPNAYTITDLPSWDRFGVGLGLSGAYRGFEVGLSYAHVFQMDRHVKNGEGRIYQQSLGLDGNITNGYAVNEGRYHSSFDVLALGVTIRWEELIYNRKPGSAATASAAP